MPLGRGAAVFIAGLLRAGCRSGELSGWVLGPVVAVASAGSGLRSLGSFGRCLVCAARRWGGGSVAWGIFGLQGFPLGSSLETEQSATYCSLVFRVGLSELFVSHGITHRQPRSQPS